MRGATITNMADAAYIEVCTTFFHYTDIVYQKMFLVIRYYVARYGVLYQQDTGYDFIVTKLRG